MKIVVEFSPELYGTFTLPARVTLEQFDLFVRNVHSQLTATRQTLIDQAERSTKSMGEFPADEQRRQERLWREPISTNGESRQGYQT